MLVPPRPGSLPWPMAHWRRVSPASCQGLLKVSNCRVASWLLLTFTGHLAITAHCTLHTAHCTLHTENVLGILNTENCTLHVTHCTLHTAHYTLHTAHYTLNSEQCKLHFAHCTLHTTYHNHLPQPQQTILDILIASQTSIL